VNHSKTESLSKRKHLPCLFCYPHQTGSTLRTRTTDHFGRHGHRTPLYCKTKYTGRRGAGEIRAGRRREKQAGGSRNARSGWRRRVAHSAIGWTTSDALNCSGSHRPRARVTARSRRNLLTMLSVAGTQLLPSAPVQNATWQWRVAPSFSVSVLAQRTNISDLIVLRAVLQSSARYFLACVTTCCFI